MKEEGKKYQVLKKCFIFHFLLNKKKGIGNTVKHVY